MRILICGDRKWKDGDAIRREMLNLHYHNKNTCPIDQFTVIEGEAPGADSWGREISLELGIPKENILKFPAPWSDIKGKPDYQIGTRRDYWKAADPYRNKQMLDEGKPDIILAFHSDITKSSGTLDMIKQANKAGIPVRLFAK